MPHSGREESSRHKVYRHVKDAIIAQEYRPGDMVYERELAQALGVSRTPVREALQALQDEGWLTVRPRKGSVVNPLSHVEIEEVLQIRSIVAAASIIFAVDRLGPSDSAYLNSLIIRQERAATVRDHNAFMDADMEFHLALVRLTGNRRLVSITSDLLDNFRRIGLEALGIGRDFTGPIAEHKAILEALDRREAEEARRLMVMHIWKNKDALS